MWVFNCVLCGVELVTQGPKTGSPTCQPGRVVKIVTITNSPFVRIVHSTKFVGSARAGNPDHRARPSISESMQADTESITEFITYGVVR